MYFLSSILEGPPVHDLLDSIACFAAIPKNRHPLIQFPYKRFKNEWFRLEQAHQIMERLYVVYHVSLTSKTIYNNLTPQRENLLREINKEVEACYNEKEGSRFIRECTDTGYYLQVLRIHFFCRPQLLKNPNVSGGDSYMGYTVLHMAVASNCCAFHPKFIDFICTMDAIHKLGLTQSKDSKNRNPLQLLHEWQRDCSANSVEDFQYAGIILQKYYNSLSGRGFLIRPPLPEIHVSRYYPSPLCPTQSNEKSFFLSILNLIKKIVHAVMTQILYKIVSVANAILLNIRS